MQAVVNGSGATVTVSGAVAEKNYNGDNHVVGRTFSGDSYSNTLGTSDGATGPLDGQRTPGSQNYYDTFIVNNTSLAAGTNSDRVTITFTLPVGAEIVSLSFDYEIFPNANCPRSTCSPMPDFTLKADNVQKLYTQGVTPASGTGNNSPLSNNEQALQFIGVSGVLSINDADNVTTLEFIDWPEMIGIDNLVVNTTPPPNRNVPEPSSMLLLGLGLFGLRALLARRARKQEK